MKYYNVVNREECFVLVKSCEIEDLQDNFITEEKLNEEYDAHSYYNRGDTRLYLHRASIKKYMQEWVDSFKPDALSCTTYPYQLDSLLSYKYSGALYEYTPFGHTISGTRMYNNQRKAEAKRAQIQKREEYFKAVKQAEAELPYTRQNFVSVRDSNILIRAAASAISNKYGCNVSCLYVHNDKSIQFAKRNLSWRELQKDLKKYLAAKKYPVDLPFVKKIWDNPDLYFGKAEKIQPNNRGHHE